MTFEGDAEVLDAELVEPEVLPALAEPAPRGRALVDRHTMLRPGQQVPTEEDRPRYSEADFRISQATADLQDQAAPENTSRQYRSARGQFTAWCDQQGRVPLPCTTATFTEYVGHLIQRGLAPSSVQVAMSAIRSWHPDGQQPGTKAASEMLRKHAKNWARRRRPRKAPAIKSDLLAQLLATCDGGTPADLRDACLLTVGWGMLARRSELAHLLIDDLVVEDDGVSVFVAFSKTDQDAKGQSTFVPANPADPAQCPVARTRAWLEELARLGVHDGPLFRALTTGGTLASRKVAERGDALSPDAIGAIVTRRGRRAGVALHLTAHGVRRGPAQEIADNGGDPTGQGRWKPGSTTVRKHYVEPAQGRTNNPIAALHAKRAAGPDGSAA
ncbi:tyrosine-type recombinase/integrase [Kitasatospora cineracea]|uniref:Site-specific recombinase XerD n=1 Tax=Kitasatospora cineracea TaxID=88074 RepID=A0A3N4R9G2_9ACTN|nr:tyrosine-type recombinase/integrase [Kitasatospora cineracea]RPE27251.1 site-specific recombinase XerD [Kitasatospora cineracea]